MPVVVVVVVPIGALRGAEDAILVDLCTVSLMEKSIDD